ncbi:hypothetical protein GCM10007350_08350 [Jeongeupia chitinilytica]|uniref:Uncharacterized protein n=1 Tax=Jeongeupia chitinilytica TaxID=1041641 RepID=A0ABQ3GWG4_9NEIS|nr:hypothetical protein GCM10007350_08350 [Jeongeupia chitinilytica]
MNMTIIIACELPERALLQRYKRDGSYTDCYYMDMPRHIAMSEYISTFYTTSLFKVERKILALAAGKHIIRCGRPQPCAGARIKLRCVEC